MIALRRNFSVCFLRDCLRNRVTAFVVFPLFFVCCVSLSQESSAGFDLYAGGTLRSYPLASVMEAESGYGILLRGSANSPFSSYARARVYGSSAGIYNSLDGALEFFPLAILGARVGGEAIRNDQKYSAYDCGKYGCLGRFDRTYVEGEFTLGAGPMFLQGRWRRERWTQENPDAGDFIDPTSGVALKGSGDSQTVYYGVMGLKLSPKWTLLGVLRYSENDQLGGWSRFPYGAVRYKAGSFTASVGAGLFESSLKAESVSLLGLIRWDFAPSLALR